MLVDLQWHEYALIAEATRMTSSDLSGHLQKLNGRRYAETKRAGQHSYWRLTELGKEKLSSHIDASRRLFAVAEECLQSFQQNDRSAGDTGKKLAQDYRAGATIRELADSHGLTFYSARETLLAEGVLLRRNGPTPPSAPPEMVNSYSNGSSIHDVAKEYSVSYDAARRMLIAAGVKLRPKSNPAKGKAARTPSIAAKPINADSQVDPDSTTAEMVRKYNGGQTLEGLAEEYSRSYRAVRNLLLEAGVTMRPPKIQLPPTPPGMVNAYNHGWSIRQLATKHDMTYSRTRRVLLAEGVVLRGVGRPGSAW
ncbi:transcriptional regulator [Amycolatopsis roodepoortensis]|uniref:transcriptional regulator n=1 Tax=Amycolatopsis roodepoortensis TaxID=700274 RepID=UPI00214C2FAB|nr:transcriptional regulator [Amycolatopsis roodepoortensis]UUV34557.1 transcriptional regulator [Amycolatopsis roodepoortensis]